MSRPQRIRAVEIFIRQLGPEFGGVTMMPGVDDDIWEKADGFLYRWGLEGVGVGQRMEIKILWEDGQLFSRQMVLDPEQEINIGRDIYDELVWQSRCNPPGSEKALRAAARLERYEFGAMLGAGACTQPSVDELRRVLLEAAE